MVIGTNVNRDHTLCGIYTTQELAKTKGREVLQEAGNEVKIMQWRLNGGGVALWSYELEAKNTTAFTT